jgi:hypothetical protein
MSKIDHFDCFLTFDSSTAADSGEQAGDADSSCAGTQSLLTADEH